MKNIALYYKLKNYQFEKHSHDFFVDTVFRVIEKYLAIIWSVQCHAKTEKY